jgi:hypothetical protein
VVDEEYRLGVDGENLVKRRLKLAGVNDYMLASAIDEIDQIYGVNEIYFNEESHYLFLAYDACRTSLQCIENVLAKYKIPLDKGLFSRFKEEYYQFVDENIKENAKREPFSCHKVSPRK